MTVLAPERAEEILAGWRRGLAEDGLENPAGPVFAGSYTESEITMTGGWISDAATWDIQSLCAVCCPA